VGDEQGRLARGPWPVVTGELRALDNLGHLLRVLADPAAGQDVLAALLEGVEADLGATGGVLAVRRGAVLQPLAATGELADQQPVQLSEPVPLADSVRSGVTQWLPASYPASRAAGPGPEVGSTAPRAIAAVPLRADGEVVGAFGLAFRPGRVLTDLERSYVGDVAEVFAIYLARWHPGGGRLGPLDEVADDGGARGTPREEPSPFTFVGLLTPSGKLTEANRAAVDAAGLRLDDVLGRPLWETYWWNWSPEVQRRLRAEIERAASGLTRRFEVDMRVQEGSRVRLDLSLVPLVAGGQVHAIVPSGIDVTGRGRHQLDLSGMANLARRMSAALTTDEVSRILVESSSGVLGSSHVVVGLVDRATGTIEVQTPPGTDPEIVRRYARMPLAQRSLLTDVVRRGETIVVANPDIWRARYPEAGYALARSELAAMAVAPLRDSSGAVFGVVGIGWAEPVDDDTELRAGVESVADLCSRTLQRTHLFDAQDELVRRLQGALLPEVPLVRGLDIAVRYLPASTDLGFSGDWYDLVTLSSERTAVIVGDIAGHGIPAAAQMSHVRAVVNTLARLGTPVPAIFSRAQPLLTHFDDPFIGTATLFVVDTGRDEVSYAYAGHPPIVVRDPAGKVGTLDGARGPALGMPTGSVERTAIPFPPGSVAVAYTDGLVERRTLDLAAGIDQLSVVVGSASPADDASTLAERIVHAMTRLHRLSDDVAMVVVRRIEEGAGHPPPGAARSV